MTSVTITESAREDILLAENILNYIRNNSLIVTNIQKVLYNDTVFMIQKDYNNALITVYRKFEILLSAYTSIDTSVKEYSFVFCEPLKDEIYFQETDCNNFIFPVTRYIDSSFSNNPFTNVSKIEVFSPSLNPLPTDYIQQVGTDLTTKQVLKRERVNNIWSSWG